ncbi:MAG TPA: guanine deaminase, partial [Rhodobacteraceae bacterium]|nr:guanine deaminase [Paracoccaceae bacterium]
MDDRKIIKGRVLSFSENPFNHHFNFNSLNIDNKYIYVNNDQIEFIDDTPGLDPEYENAERIDHSEHVIMAGGGGGPVHYPPNPPIASWGKSPIDWFKNHTFPPGKRCGGPAYAAGNGTRYFVFFLRTGT